MTNPCLDAEVQDSWEWGQVFLGCVGNFLQPPIHCCVTQGEWLPFSELVFLPEMEFKASPSFIGT